jgi:quercetin dioxygenase-like cupin family protein
MMWGQKGGRSLITGNSPAAWLLRILIFLFLAGGIILFIAANSGGARAQDGLSVKGLGDVTRVEPPQDNPIPASGGALVAADPMPVEPVAPVDRPNDKSGPIEFKAAAKNLPHALDAGWKGAKTCEPLDETRELKTFRCTFPPSAGHERHFHPRHWGYVVAGGTMRIVDAKGERVVTLKSGDTWWSDGVNWHEALNIGETTAIYVIVEPKVDAP